MAARGRARGAATLVPLPVQQLAFYEMHARRLGVPRRTFPTNRALRFSLSYSSMFW